MHFSISLATTFLLAGGAFAQYGAGYNYDSASGGSQNAGSSGASSSSPMSVSTSSSVAVSPATTGTANPSGQVMVHVVKVGNKKGSLTFEPNNLQAPVGHMVQFHFYPKPIKNNNASVNGFFSGFMPVKPDAAMMPSYTIMINDTKPIWYYCSQGDHCQDGMVGVINPPAANKSRTIESFTALANKATENLSPGQSLSTSSSSSSSVSSNSGSSNSGSSSYGSGDYSSSASGPSTSSAAAAPAASDSSTSSGTVTMPLSGTNSSTTTTAGAVTPSGSAGGQAPVAFVPGSGAMGLRVNLLGNLGLAGVLGVVAAVFL
ncbi:MAG: hypothetical protein Q9186_006846 [Xanthomendoza sp. 1 TL-2023]